MDLGVRDAQDFGTASFCHNDAGSGRKASLRRAVTFEIRKYIKEDSAVSF
jgi:hypothetical protein